MVSHVKNYIFPILCAVHRRHLNNHCGINRVSVHISKGKTHFVKELTFCSFSKSLP